MLVSDQELNIDIDQIKKIKTYSKGIKKNIGGVIVGMGIATMSLAALSIPVGAVVLIMVDSYVAFFGLFLIVSAPPLGLAGFATYKLGSVIREKNYKLTKKWMISKK